jgi:hypothetical protein
MVASRFQKNRAHPLKNLRIVGKRCPVSMPRMIYRKGRKTPAVLITQIPRLLENKWIKIYYPQLGLGAKASNPIFQIALYFQHVSLWV